MKKRGKRPSLLKREVKELIKEEEKILFSLLFWSVKKRHFYSLASIIFSLAVGLAIITKIRQGGNIVYGPFVFWVFVITLIVLVLLVIRKLREEKKVHNFENIINRLVAIYVANMLFVFVFYTLFFISSGQLLLFREIILLLSLSTVFGTVSLHMH